MNILFLCVANSARSQMAEGLARNIFGQTAEVMSAGSSPSFVHPMSIHVMSEWEIDIRDQTSKAVTEIDLSVVDQIITLCADEVCPYIPSERAIEKKHWPLPDPAQEAASKQAQLDQFRAVRDELAARIRTLKSSLETKHHE